jgi:transposase
MDYLHFIGIDVSKNWIDVALHGATAATPQRFPNSSGGFAAVAAQFATELPATFVVLEATGGYENALVAFLLERNVAVHRACPLAAKHFIRSVKLRGKTDALDAVALARFAAERHSELALCKSESAAQERLQALQMRRADLVAMRVAEQARAKHPNYAGLQKSLAGIHAAIAKELVRIEKEIARLIAASAELTAKREVMTSVVGVGQQTAHALLAEMPELGQLTRRQAASLAGCAPHPRDSGKRSGYRATGGGRAAVKRSLFMAAMAASRYHQTLKEFYEKLIKNGKKRMVALTAVMRKIITILNAKLRDNFYATT